MPQTCSSKRCAQLYTNLLLACCTPPPAPTCRRGYNIGVRLIDEFLAKAQIGQCGSFADTADVIAKIGFKMFLGITAEVRPCSL